VWRFPRTLTGVKIPRNADWCGDPPEHWAVWGLSITLTGAEIPQDTGMEIPRNTCMEIPNNTDWCADSPEQ
jgi:hypothetical protein